MRYPMCLCAAAGGVAYVHEAGCPVAAINKPPPTPDPATPTDIYKTMARRINRMRGVGKRRRRPPPIPSYRFKLQFNFTRPINIALWRAIKAPAGWRKCPTSAGKQLMYRGVRFQCDDLKFALTPEEITLLHMKLLMSLALDCD